MWRSLWESTICSALWLPSGSSTQACQPLWSTASQGTATSALNLSHMWSRYPAPHVLGLIKSTQNPQDHSHKSWVLLKAVDHGSVRLDFAQWHEVLTLEAALSICTDAPVLHCSMQSNSAVAVAETVQHFITAMDSLKLNMVAVDQVRALAHLCNRTPPAS